MSELGFKKLYAQIDMLSYSERIRLLDKIVQTLHAPAKSPRKETSDFPPLSDYGKTGILV
ncbi:hypothetical protein [Treponema sp.]|uniref:hypothetical protein n=1 Tax=Treponema sp. TaxID=166 RepID=UPI0025F7B5F1|nr:hypothetical protein [Treponema sp.]